MKSFDAKTTVEAKDERPALLERSKQQNKIEYSSYQTQEIFNRQHDSQIKDFKQNNY
jgi:hypothetical protein